MADATAGIILSIGSKFGPGGLASLQAGVQMVGRLGKAVAGSIKELDKFSLVYRSLQIDISKADAAAKGLIPTMEMMRAANKLTQADVRATSDEMEMLAKMTIMAAKSTGEDMNVALTGFVNALSGGGTEYVRKFGMQISETGTAASKMAEFMRVATMRTADFNVELETSSELMASLAENAGTMLDLAWAQSQRDQTGFFFSMNESISDANTAIMKLNKAQDDLGRSGEGLVMTLWRMHEAFMNGPGRIDEYRRALVRLHNEQEKGRYAEQAGDVQMGLIGAPGGTKDIGDVEAMEAFYGFDQQTTYDTQKKTLSETKKKKKTSGTGGKGGGKGGAVDPYAVTIADILANISTTGIAGDIGLGGAPIITGDEYDLDAEMAAYQVEQQLRAMEIQEFYRNEAIEQEKFHASHAQRMLGIDEQYARDAMALWESSLSGKMIIAEGFLSHFSALQAAAEGQSRALWEVGRAAAYGENIFTTALMATKAYNSFIGMGPAGPVLAGLAASAATAVGMLNARKIRSQKYGGMSGGGGGGRGGSTSVGGASSGGGSAAGYGSGYGSGGGSGGGDTNYIVNGSVYTTQELAEEIKAVHNANRATGRWAHGWKDSD